MGFLFCQISIVMFTIFSTAKLFKRSKFQKDIAKPFQMDYFICVTFPKF